MTYTNYALDNMLTNIINFGRPEVKQILVLITDGKSTKGLKLKDKKTKTKVNTAQRLHDNGVLTFAIGVGSETDQDELDLIATDPNQQFKYQIDSYKDLESIRHQIGQFVCQQGQGLQIGRSGGLRHANYQHRDSESLKGKLVEIEPWGDLITEKRRG